MLTVVWRVGFSFRWSPLRFLVELSLAGPVGQLVKMFKSEILCGHKRPRCMGLSRASVLLFLLWWFITLFYLYGCQCGRLHSMCLWFGQHKYTYSISFSVVLALFLIYFLHFFTIALSLNHYLLYIGSKSVASTSINNLDFSSLFFSVLIHQKQISANYWCFSLNWLLMFVKFHTCFDVLALLYLSFFHLFDTVGSRGVVLSVLPRETEVNGPLLSDFYTLRLLGCAIVTLDPIN